MLWEGSDPSAESLQASGNNYLTLMAKGWVLVSVFLKLVLLIMFAVLVKDSVQKTKCAHNEGRFGQQEIPNMMLHA